MTVSTRTFAALFAVLVLNTALMLVFAFKYLHAVNTPQSTCLRPFTPTHLELAPPRHDVEVWL